VKPVPVAVLGLALGSADTAVPAEQRDD
jgi:hypothetical protein